MPKADAEDGNLAEQLLDLGIRTRNRIGVAGTVGKEHTVGVHREDVFGGGVPGNCGELAAHTHEVLEDGKLRAAVVGNDLVLRRRGRGERERLGFRQVVEAEGRLLGARDRLGEVHADDRLACAHLSKEALGVGVESGEHRALGAVVAHVANECARVDALDGDDVVLTQEVGQRKLAAPVRGHLAHVAHDEPAQCRLLGLAVLAVHTVVADLGVGHRDDLARVARVGDHLEVALQRGVEADFAEHFALRRARGAAEHGAVFEHEQRRCTERLRGVLEQLFRDLAHIVPFRSSPPSRASSAIVSKSP